MESSTTGPAVILIDPQMGENIGATARAMYNFGLTRLRLVRPRDGWPSEKAEAMAAGADPVIRNVAVFDTTEAAIADLQAVYATTARPRDLVKAIMTPARAAADVRAKQAAGLGCGILFGPERAGLTTDDVVLAQTVIQAPLNPAFSSLNLAQAVLLVAYEWFKAADETLAKQLDLTHTRPANAQEIQGLFDHLEGELDESGFLFPPEKRPSMVRNIRTMLQRASLTEQEVKTWRGIVKALAHGRPPRRR